MKQKVIRKLSVDQILPAIKRGGFKLVMNPYTDEIDLIESYCKIPKGMKIIRGNILEYKIEVM